MVFIENIVKKLNKKQKWRFDKEVVYARNLSDRFSYYEFRKKKLFFTINNNNNNKVFNYLFFFSRRFRLLRVCKLI